MISGIRAIRNRGGAPAWLHIDEQAGVIVAKAKADFTERLGDFYRGDENLSYINKMYVKYIRIDQELRTRKTGTVEEGGPVHVPRGEKRLSRNRWR